MGLSSRWYILSVLPQNTLLGNHSGWVGKSVGSWLGEPCASQPCDHGRVALGARAESPWSVEEGDNYLTRLLQSSSPGRARPPYCLPFIF